MRTSGILKTVIVLWVTPLVLASCEPRKQRDESPIQNAVPEYVVGVVLDLSGSYQQLMLEGDGKAYKFFIGLVDRYFSERAGADDRLVIAQISARERALLWEGTPAALKQEFANAGAFKKYLLERSHPAGSRVHDSIADMVDYVKDYPGVAEGKTRSAVFVLSDMEDNFPEPERSEKRLVQSLKAYAKAKGVVGMYWVDHRYTGTWKRHLRESGYKSIAVESEIVSSPTLPAFEQ